MRMRWIAVLACVGCHSGSPEVDEPSATRAPGVVAPAAVAPAPDEPLPDRLALGDKHSRDGADPCDGGEADPCDGGEVALGGLGGKGGIGEGKVGTIGHGRGYGAGGPRTRPASTMKVGTTKAVGDLDPDIIRRYLRRALPRIRMCYEQQLKHTPTLAGRVAIEFTITPTGTVMGVKAAGLQADVDACIEGTVRSMQFPKPKGGGSVKVTYPLELAPVS